MQERRQHPRFQKEYTVIFYLKSDPHKAFDMSRMLDISKGGLKFFSYESYQLGSIIVFQVKFPFLYPNVVNIEGQIIGIDPVLAGKTCKIRVMFVNFTPEVNVALDQMEKINLKNTNKWI
ncbi:MAG: PilZ domain-containing protein [Candidatus Omnitrophota bacterium]